MTFNPIYLSHTISNETPLYGGKKNIYIKKQTFIDRGDTANSLYLSFPNHSGTHIDVPFHFFNNGKKITDYEASFWIFNNPQIIDVDVRKNKIILFNHIKKSIGKKTDLLLIRTGYEKFRSQDEYWLNNPGISSNLAKILREDYPNIRGLGIDFISVTSPIDKLEGKHSHQVLLGNSYSSEPIVIIEDMTLVKFTNKIEKVIILPLIIAEADGAPCTIIGI